MPSLKPTSALLRSGLSAALAVGLLGMSAQAVEPASSVPCERPTGWRDTVSNKLMVNADPAAETEADADAPYPEPEDVNDVDTDPLEMVPVAIDPKMPPQVLAMLLSHAMQQGQLVVLLLPKP